MIELATISIAIRVASAILLLWGVSVAVRRHRLFWPFLPLVLYFIGISAMASAEFYEIFVNQLQIIFDSIFLLFYVLTLIVVLVLIKKSV